MVKSKPLPTLAEVAESLYYDATTGAWHHKQTGQEAGSLHRNGYVRLWVKGQEYLAHRLAWLWVYKVDPAGMQIDHIDMDKTNNKISNLRLATHGQNNHHKRTWSNTGIKGIIKYKGKYRATIDHQNTRYYLGTFNSLELAVKAHAAKVKELYGDFATYGLSL